ncbi:MAG: cytochrome b N-terminal domain-containing protein [Alphaproteobacteria bacterium]|nr:cytochrome b N-terminal domain-containing protein [Alphaproteobacteria bacterium]
MGSANREKFDNTVVEWIDSRMPIFTILNKEYGVFPTPRNFNYFWNFGAIAMFMLMTMIITGIILAMHYTADTKLAFDSVERIMRDVNGGWLLRYIHMNGASFFFIAVYIHMFRGIYYGSYKKPRELLWILGVIIFLLMMATAFIGYVLPWGQMSLWGATVITNLFSAVPFVGNWIVETLWGGYSVDNPTLTRFFALHFLLPFVIFAVVFLHVWALHVSGSNNPLGIEPKGPQDTLPFNPYYTAKDTFGLVVFMVAYAFFIFFAPDFLGHPDNYIPADPLVTPAHIVPEWYFLPFYAILRAVTFSINWYLIIGAGLCAYAFIKWMTKNKERESFFVKEYMVFVLPALFLFVLGAVIAFIPVSEQQFVDGELQYVGIARIIEGIRYYFTFDFLIPDSIRGTTEAVEMRVAIDALLIPISAKLGGVLAMFGSIALLIVLPWLDSHPVRSARFRPLFRIFVLLFTVSVGILGYAGSQPADKVYWSTCLGDAVACEALAHGGHGAGAEHHSDASATTIIKLDNTMLAQAFTGFYFAFFLIIIPLLGRFEKARALPYSIHEAVLGKEQRAGV